MTILNTKNMLSELKSDNRQAMKLIFQTHYQQVCTTVARIIRDADSVDDVAQAVFIKVWEKRHKFEVNTSLKAYLSRMAVNEAISFLRKHKKHDHQEITPFVGGFASDSDKPLLRKELAANIDAAIDQLPPRCALVFRLSRYEELSYKEIAQKLDISVKTVENQMGKALKLLRVSLRSYL